MFLLLGIGCLVVAVLSRKRRVGCSISGLFILAVAFDVWFFDGNTWILVTCGSVALAAWFASIYIGKPRVEILDRRLARNMFLASLGTGLVITLIGIWVDPIPFLWGLGLYSMAQGLHSFLEQLRARKFEHISQNPSTV